MHTEEHVVFSTLDCSHQKKIGVARLNRAKSLNALNLEMCAALLKQCKDWQTDPRVAAVVLVAEGEKAFCAGGDVAEVVKQIKAGGQERYAYGDTFFTVEYELDLLIHQFGKPFFALAQGITMGGGLGLLAGASHRILSERAKLAMPEIHIGLFPDVGGGFFLNRMPCRSGWFMALTGHIINEHDAVLGGLADMIVPADRFAALIDEIKRTRWNDDAAENFRIATAVLNYFEHQVTPDIAQAPMWQRMPQLRAMLHAPTVVHVRDALTAAAEMDPWFEASAKNLAKGSPTTAHVAFEYLQRSQKKSVAEVLALDLILAKQFPRHVDFLEGVRAVLIDKDKTPNWAPNDFDKVSAGLVAEHFKPLT